MTTQNTSDNRRTLLLVEDDDDHAELAERAFDSLRESVALRRLNDGEQALDYLLRRERYTKPRSRPRPELILLDLRLPKVGGLKVLRQLKDKAETRHIPTVILTTSEAGKDRARAYEVHANAFLVKPLEFIDFNALLRDLGLFWFVWNRNSPK